MIVRKITPNVFWYGAVDWDRRLFDALIPLPDGTSYNAYMVKGDNKTALIDTVDPAKWETLKFQLENVESIDFIVANHAEQDHSGSIPMVLEKYPESKVICTAKCRDMLTDLLNIDNHRFIIAEDGQVLDLGGRTLKFIHTPWVHWPETMVTYLAEEKILFSCDFFGSHLATTDLYVSDHGMVYEAAKRYYAEIMMPFRKIIRKNLDKIDSLGIETIAPSHGPIYRNPEFIMNAYRNWSGENPQNEVVIPYISMHGSTERMVEYLVSALAVRDIKVHRFDLSNTDIGKLAIALVDAGTLVLGTPTVHVGPHPAAVYAVYLANALKPKIRFASVIGSYGWNSRVVEQISSLIPNLKVEVLAPVLCKGMPDSDTFKKLEDLASDIALKHRKLNGNSGQLAI